MRDKKLNFPDDFLNKIIQADALRVLKFIPENSIDAIITDPPYGIGFMNKEWDDPIKQRELIEKEIKKTKRKFKERKSSPPASFTKNIRPELSLGTKKENEWYQKWVTKWAVECFRVLKPGGYTLIFGFPRTYHRLASGIEDAGFEIRDCIMWIFGQGFPKSMDISKQFKKMDLEKEAEKWKGWGTALKPAYEPIVLARKPILEKNVALNVLKWGTGGMNIDECRIGTEILRECKRGKSVSTNFMSDGITLSRQGRFPANLILECICDEMIGQNEKIVIHDAPAGTFAGGEPNRGSEKNYRSYTTKIIIHTNPECIAYQLDQQAGIRKSGYMSPKLHKRNKTSGEYQSPCGIYGKFKNEYLSETYGDIGGVSRFFYCAKATSKERWFYCKKCQKAFLFEEIKEHKHDEKDLFHLIFHPTQKPLKLMEYLVKLITPPGGIVLDLFAGTGTTLVACKKMGYKFIGIEKEKEYVEIARTRLEQIQNTLF